MTENKSKYLCDIKRNIIDLLRDMNYTGCRIVIDANSKNEDVSISVEKTERDGKKVVTVKEFLD